MSPAWSSRSTRSPDGRPGDDVGQELGRDGDRAVDVDLARDPVGDPDLEVRRGQLEAAVLGPDEDVAEDRQGAAGRDRPADDRQAAGQVLLHDRDVHGRFTPGRRSWSPAVRAASAAARPVRPLGPIDRSVDPRWEIPPYLRTSSSPSCGGRCGPSCMAERGGRCTRWPAGWTADRPAWTRRGRPVGERRAGRTARRRPPDPSTTTPGTCPGTAGIAALVHNGRWFSTESPPLSTGSGRTVPRRTGPHRSAPARRSASARLRSGRQSA